MQNDGTILRGYVETHRLPRTQLAKEIGITKQGLYQLYKSKEFGPDTISKIEKALNAKWQDIKGNVAGKAPRETAEQKKAAPDPGRQSLERSVELLAEDKIRSTAIIERLMDMLESRLSYGTQGIELPQPVAPGTNVEPLSRPERLSPSGKTANTGKQVGKSG